MAIPTTQKECTTRRIASLIIGLWDKVKDAFLSKTSRGAANGVASLDENGKVPSSQLPSVPTGNLPSNSSSSAGIVASGSGQQDRVWGTDSNGNPSWSKVRANMLESDINISGNCLTAGRNLGGFIHIINDKKYIYLGKVTVNEWIRYSARFQVGPGDRLLNCNIMINVQRNTNSPGFPTDLDAVFLANTEGFTPEDTGIYTYYDSSTYTLYFYLGVISNFTFVRCLFSNGFSFDTPSTTPSSVTRIANNRRAILGPTDSGVGSSSVPVFVNSKGVLVPCTFPLDGRAKYLIYSNATLQNQGTGNYALVAAIKYDTTMPQISVYGELIFVNGDSGYIGKASLELVYSNTTKASKIILNVYDIDFSNNIDVIVTNDSSSTSIKVYVKNTYNGWSGVRFVPIANPTWGTSTNCYGSMTLPTGTFNATVTGTQLTVQKKILVYKDSGQIGGPSIPVYVAHDGKIIACTGIPVIEHVTSIPSNPTVGTIYAL